MIAELLCLLARAGSTVLSPAPLGPASIATLGIEGERPRQTHPANRRPDAIASGRTLLLGVRPSDTVVEIGPSGGWTPSLVLHRAGAGPISAQRGKRTGGLRKMLCAARNLR